MTNTIVNHFNEVLYKLQFDINTCVEVDKEYIIFDLNNLFTDSNKNFVELKQILSKYKIIFNIKCLSIQFTPFFKLIQEILTFNYNHFVNSAKNKTTCKNDDNLRVLFILNQFFKHPFISEKLLNESVINTSFSSISTTTKISKLLDLNYDLLPKDFALSSNESNIKKIRGGKVKYQGTWVTCNFGIKLLKLIGGFDVLNQLLTSIFKFLTIDFKSSLSQSNRALNKINFSLNTKSIVWTHFPCDYIKLRDYKSASRVGKKRGKYNKTKKHAHTKIKQIATVPSSISKAIRPAIFKKNSIKLPPIVLDSLRISKKISYRSLSNQDFLNKIAKNHIKKCNSFAFKSQQHIKNLSAGSDNTIVSQVNSRHIVSPCLLSACNLHYEKDIKNIEIFSKHTCDETGNYSSKIRKNHFDQSKIFDDSMLLVPHKPVAKELLPPFEISSSSITSSRSEKQLFYSTSYSLCNVDEDTFTEAITTDYNLTPKTHYNENLDMTNKTLVNKSPDKSSMINFNSLKLLEKVNEPIESDCFLYQKANILAYSDFGYKISTRSENNSYYLPLDYENRPITKTCQNENLITNVQNESPQDEMFDSVLNYMDDKISRSSKYL